MTDFAPDHSLAGQLLLAMPTIGDPRFSHAVIFVCAHDANGAMGLMLTQPVPGLTLGALMLQLDIKNIHADIILRAVMNGGPVESGRGFVLHGPGFYHKETVIVNDQFSVTATIDALQEIAKGSGPEQMLFALGYAGWQAGQLEQELADNAWLTLPADAGLIFNTPPADKWEAAMQKLGVNPTQLTGISGHA
jgi:putative transcriptional regulator